MLAGKIAQLRPLKLVGRKFNSVFLIVRISSALLAKRYSRSDDVAANRIAV